ncbi:hypothetical protein LSCM1_02930 [Leishmania martiniquensis]|uniref:Uncharacterized protein n=1 Tax=Leishmania martiniquensis TaxID=1580590 RepID=A0A836HM03_9TRYP|nr:hypothetical protein LSCM1_02930 [Leishmania martiniquensis]
MSASRKRYRPLDSAEERTVTANESLQLLPLEDEQSYCFSWPEAPLTQWLQGDVPYASLYQLYGNTASSVGGGGVSSHTMRSQSSGLGGACVAASALYLPQGKSLSATLASSGRRDALGLSSPTGTASLTAPQHPWNIEIPPVFLLLDDFGPAPARHAPGSKGSGGEESESREPCGGDDDVRSLRWRVRGTVAGVRHDSIDPSSAFEPWAFGAKKRASPSTEPSPSIVVQSDTAAHAVPHPLAPPRPQSATEDSIFSLSATQLADVVAAGVPMLYASAARADESGPLQGIEGSHISIVTSAEGSPSGEAGAVSKSKNGASSRHDRQAGYELTEEARREIEHEVVGLEWRTWSQSQRTAAALQRILSLEAAVPFERSGAAQRDAWRGAVYRLWLQWRQHRRPPLPESAAVGDLAASSTPAAGTSLAFSSTTLVPSATSLQDLEASASTPPASAALALSKGVLARPHHQPRLPWGAPLLAGAYLYGTSNDYFISLPPSSTSTVGQVGKGGGSSGSNYGDLTMNSAATTSLWPAVSRRRGTYSFLRWKVELYEAQLSRTAVAAEDREDSDEVKDETVMRNKGRGIDDRDRSGSGASRKVSRFSKGPFGGALPDALAPPRRSGRVGDSDRDAPATASSRSTERKGASAPVGFSSGHAAINGLMSVSHMKALLHTTVLTQPLTELEMDDEPTTVMERLACSDLRRETDAWRVWLSRV